MQKKPIKTYSPIVKLASGKDRNFVHVPTHLIPMQFGRYPPDNAVTFERWFMENWIPKDERERIYLPVQWTALYCNNGYGNEKILHTIQKYLDTLDATKKYYTIVQYDDGILNDISKLDICVMAMSGPRIDFSLPLLCTPHKFNFSANQKKDIYCNFIGNLTHPIRAQIVNQLKGKEGYYISTENHKLHDYCKIIARSKYTLCPRGYGKSSFRIQEAIDFGSIPVYISDEFVFPYNMPAFPFGHAFKMDADIEETLRLLDNEQADILCAMMIDANRSLYTYAGCKREILNYLKNANDKTQMPE